MLRTITAPTAEATSVVSLADAKAQLRVDFPDEDIYITGLIAVALENVERMVQRRYRPQTLEWVTGDLHNGMVLPLAPVTSVVSLTYLQYPYGPAAVLDPSAYIVVPDGQATKITRPYNLIWPWIGQGPEPVVIRFVCGYDPASSSPDPAPSPSVLHAIKLLVSHWYERREPLNALAQSGTTELPYGVTHLLWPERWD
ncbi:phage conserved hypothetical protein, phiE125 gp8 family [Rhizobiales bacterium GAS188]|nr:phage conserved hypothetical protein, phiE125 gp8 family [Rhizobiales bacterium GAS188]